MEILNTTVIPDAPTVVELREFYQNEPRIVQVTIIGTAQVTLYGRMGPNHSWVPLFVTDENRMESLFLPPHIYAMPDSMGPTSQVIVSVNISRSRTQ